MRTEQYSTFSPLTRFIIHCAEYARITKGLENCKQIHGQNEVLQVAGDDEPCENQPMEQVFVSQNLIEVEMRKERLEQAGIRCMIKSQRSSSLTGEIPFTEVFPEL